MSVRRQVPGPDAEVGQIAHAATTIVAWAMRNDVQQELMRRAKCDLPNAHLWLLGRLEPGPARLSELAQWLGVDNSTVTPQAQRLERDGLIAREPDPADGRASLLYITRSGRALITRLRATTSAIYADILADWSPTELARAAMLLSELAEAVSATTLGDEPPLTALGRAARR